MSSTSSSGVNPEMKLFSEVNDFCDSIFEKIKEEEAKLPYHINIIDLLRAGENAHSRILGRLLEQKNGENYEILNSFLSLLAERNSNFSNLNVQEPTISCEKGRIDILIKDKNYAIIFENKIHNAIDQDRQIERYIDKVKGLGYKELQIYVLYLSADGRKKPTDESLGKYKNTDLKDKRYIQLNFRYDILSWLKGKVLPDVRIKDVHLISAIEQYIDHLEGFFNLRTIQGPMSEELKKEILKELHIGGEPTDNNFTELNKKIDKLDKVRNQLFALKSEMEVDFLEECYEKLEEYESNFKIFSTECKLIKSTNEKNYPSVGIKACKEGFSFRILIEIERKSDKIFYGIAKPDPNPPKESKLEEFFKSFSDKEGRIESDYWWYLKKNTSYDSGCKEFKEFVEKVIKYCKDNPLEK
ncbi:PD-(D/E)XK nuclease family protein [Capnocytophaga canimorsus]|uniref:PD-(D/E)XK nuclease family protein n=1 Tax=Capnocytophaga canimorsus TaxID=28188 RepID=UPI0038596D99